MSCCDFLVCDIFILISRCVLRCKKCENINFIFLLRCFIGFTFDAIEFIILEVTETDINYVILGIIFSLEFVFLCVVVIHYIRRKKLANCAFMCIFKVLSLFAAITIFITAYDSEFLNIEDHLSNLDNTRTFFQSFVIIASLLDIALNFFEFTIHLIKTCCTVRTGRGSCWKELCILLCKLANDNGMNAFFSHFHYIKSLPFYSILNILKRCIYNII